MLSNTQYIPFVRTDATGPLNRFLPPGIDGIGTGFAATLNLPSTWILDPFGASPQLAVEMARSGHRVLVAAGNPVSRFLLEVAANPPRLVDLQAALAGLAAARKEGKRLETHLHSLYLTKCENCEREIPAEAFLWNGKTGILSGRIYNCVCGSGGEHPASPEDIENAARWARSDGLHRSRAVERVAPGQDPDRPFAEEALSFYLPRAVYALGTIINRLEGLSISDEHRRCMSALVLYAADCANALWPLSGDRPRPRQLTFPGIYRENNIWLALEAGVKAWASDEPSIPLTLWPQDPPESGGICIFEGPLRALAADLREIPVKAVVGAIPRPNQAFWILSALWSGWLWGHSAVGPFKSVLRRRRYDWQWHAEALKALFGNLAGAIAPGTTFFAAMAEPEPSFISAVLMAAHSTGWDINGLAMRAEQEPIQIRWKYSPPKGKKGRRKKKALTPASITIRRAMRAILEKRSEPMPYTQLHAATLAVLANNDMLELSEDGLASLEKSLHTALANPEFIDLEARSAPENGSWGLRKWHEQAALKGL
jgi:hypothetical protein